MRDNNTNAQDTTMTTTLRADRRELKDALAKCDRGAYPGTAAAKEESAAIAALVAFDAEHPEVIEELRREQRELRRAGR